MLFITLKIDLGVVSPYNVHCVILKGQGKSLSTIYCMSEFTINRMNFSLPVDLTVCTPLAITLLNPCLFAILGCRSLYRAPIAVLWNGLHLQFVNEAAGQC